MEIQEIIQRKRSARVTVSVQLDGQIVHRIEELRKRFADEAKKDDRLNRPPEAPAVARQLEALLEEARASEIPFTFRSIGRAAWDRLVMAHKPTPDQKEQGAEWNTDTFPPAVIAACAESPLIPETEAFAMWDSDEWSGGELLKLFGAAVQANHEVPDIPFDRIATELSRSIGQRSITALNEGFLDPSS